MASFTDRILGAARLDLKTYEEVEADTGGTGQAMAVVLLSSLAGGVGVSSLGTPGPGGIIGGIIAALAGWFVWAFLSYFIGTRLLPEPQTRADLGQLLRTTGFAQAPGILRILGFTPGLGVLILLVVSVWMLVTMVIAVRQALDYSSTMRAVGVCVVGWIFSLAIAFLVTTVVS